MKFAIKPQSLRQTEFEEFYLPFGERLKSSSRWVALAKKIPWDELYAANVASSGQGAPAFRVALGALIIQKKLRLSLEIS